MSQDETCEAPIPDFRTLNLEMLDRYVTAFPRDKDAKAEYDRRVAELFGE